MRHADGNNEIWKSTGEILFLGDSDHEAILTNHPSTLYNGDITGDAEVALIGDL